MDIFSDFSFFIQPVNDLDIVCIRSFQMNFMLQGLFHNKGKMRAFGAVAVKIFAFIPVLFKCLPEHFLGFVYLHAYFGKIGQLHWRAIFIDKAFYVHPVKLQVIILNMKSLLREMEGLVHKTSVSIVHL